MKWSIVILLLWLTGLPEASAQCGDPGSGTWENTWESCEASVNPNPMHDESHWILYDFGTLYKLTTTHIWNTNELGKTNRGFRNVAVDYSANGTDWLRLGEFEFPEGNGETRYGGFPGIDFEGECVRYVLITAMDNWGHDDCYGLAEIKFNTDVDYNTECGVITATVGSFSNGSLDVEVFPNPTADWLYVRLDGFSGKITVRILSLEGRQLISEALQAAGTSEFSFPVFDLPSGTYFLNIQTENSMTTRRFITIR